MAETPIVRTKTDSELVIERTRDAWGKWGKTIVIACLAVIVLGGGWLAYKYLVKLPKEQKAEDAVFKAEIYFGKDSLQKALNGDGQSMGLEKVISQYGGTPAGNRARYIAAAIYLKMGSDAKNDAKAVSYLKDFSTDAKQVQARAYKLLGDAYSNQDKQSDALSSYKKAAHEFEDDKDNASDYLFMAAYYADRVMNNKKEAIDLYKELKKKFPTSSYGLEADKYLAQAGEYTTD